MPTLQDGKEAIAQGNLQQARLIFEAILQENPREENAWLGLAEVMTDSEDKRICYENVLKINKNNKRAKEGIRNLEPQANPLVAALQKQAGSRAPATEASEAESESEEAGAKPKKKKRRERAGAAAEPSDGPPAYALVAVGLLLSVVLFALVSGAAFFLLTSLAGP